jgi:hypothetical protein
MPQFEDDVTDFENRYAGDKGVHARFYMFPQKNEAKSASAGRPIFEDTEFVEIFAAGNSTNIVRRPARAMDKDRFRRQYEAFKAGTEDQLQGTPLHEVPWITRSQVEELAYLRIRTLEQLANVSDAACGKHVGLYDLKSKATKALAAAEGAAPITELTKENEELKRRLDQRDKEMDTMKEQMAKLIAAVQAKNAQDDEDEEEPEGNDPAAAAVKETGKKK